MVASCGTIATSAHVIPEFRLPTAACVYVCATCYTPVYIVLCPCTLSCVHAIALYQSWCFVILNPCPLSCFCVCIALCPWFCGHSVVSMHCFVASLMFCHCSGFVPMSIVLCPCTYCLVPMCIVLYPWPSFCTHQYCLNDNYNDNDNEV